MYKSNMTLLLLKILIKQSINYLVNFYRMLYQIVLVAVECDFLQTMIPAAIHRTILYMRQALFNAISKIIFRGVV